MKYINALLIAGFIMMLAVTLPGCSKSEVARNWSLNKYGNYRVTQTSFDGKQTTWEASARPESEEHSDGFTFVDKSTGKLQMISGGTINIVEE